MPQRETDHEDPADTAATPESASAPAAHPSSEPPENADLLVWMSWPLVSWAMPVLVYLLMLKGGGWEMLILLPFMILIVPCLALLGLLPRFILRRAGAKTSPTIVSIAMIVNWWSQVLIGMSHRGVGDSGGIDSLLGEVFNLRAETQWTLWATAVLIAVGSYVAALVASTMRAETHRSLLKRPWIVWVAMGAVPLLLLGVIGGAAAAGAAQEDTAAAAEAQEWDDAQLSLVPLRHDIAETGWTITCCGMDDDDPRSYENGHRRLASMLISMDVAVNSTPETAFDDIVELVAAHHWEVTDTDVRTPTPVSDTQPDAAASPTPAPTVQTAPPARGDAWTGILTAENDSEELLSIRVESTGGADDSSAVITVSLNTAPRPASDVIEVDWWRRGADDATQPPPIDGMRFRYDEWPSLLRVAS